MTFLDRLVDHEIEENRKVKTSENWIIFRNYFTTAAVNYHYTIKKLVGSSHLGKLVFIMKRIYLGKALKIFKYKN